MSQTRKFTVLETYGVESFKKELIDSQMQGEKKSGIYDNMDWKHPLDNQVINDFIERHVGRMVEEESRL